MHDFALVGLVLIPLVASLVLFALPRRYGRAAKWAALGVSLVEVVYAAVIGFSFDTSAGAARFQFQGSWWWIKAFGVHVAFGVDGIAMVLVGITVVLVPTVILAAWNIFDTPEDAEDETVPAGRSSNTKNFMALVLMMQFFLLGAFTAMDVFLFYVLFEAMLVPMYFLIGSYGGMRRRYAAVKFFLYSLAGGLVMTASVIGLYVTTGSRTFAISELIGQVPDNATQKWLFIGFFLAFAIKAPLVPFHTWLPDAGAEAPAAGAALLVGVMDKVGTFGFLRYCLPLFPDASRWAAPLVLVLSVIGVLYAAFLAIGQRDMKRLVAYTSVAHFGFIGLGIFVFTSQGGSGAVLYMVNHGLSTGALFLLIGILIARGKSRNIGDYGGAAKTTPVLGGMFLFVGMSALALPGLSTFVSEFLVLVGTFTRHMVLAIFATLGIVLAAIYILYLYQRVFQGPVRGRVSERAASFRDLHPREVAAVAPLLVLILFLGIYPKPVLDVINPAVKATLSDVHHTDPAPILAPVAGGQK